MAPKKSGKTKRPLKDLSVKEEKARNVKAGFNPQPEPPGKFLKPSSKIIFNQ
jgi:hypothetical protein